MPSPSKQKRRNDCEPKKVVRISPADLAAKREAAGLKPKKK
jgi:hypothetical protein